jgi:NAD(P)-dependent dehydrogenase (short-subunit alcohol dehydrogenase family)
MCAVRVVPVVLIAGASRGIGLGLVREYLPRGWRAIATQRGNHSDTHLLSLATPLPLEA